MSEQPQTVPLPSECPECGNKEVKTIRTHPEEIHHFCRWCGYSWRRHYPEHEGPDAAPARDGAPSS